MSVAEYQPRCKYWLFSTRLGGCRGICDWIIFNFGGLFLFIFQKKTFFTIKVENYTYLCSMISLSRHIELLLLEHDCVIVPGLGGFIANYSEAQYDGAGDSLFLPPYRTIRFNQQLQMNDGLLVQSYMAAYDASYPAAYLQMEKDIDKVVYELDTIGEVTFEKIGVLRKEINQSIAFIPSEMSILTPSLYGLYSYEVKSLNSMIKEREVKEALNAASAMTVRADEECKTKNAKRENNVISISHLRKRWIDVGISAAAAIVLLFCVSYQALRNTTSDTDTVVAAFYTTNNLEGVSPADDSKVEKSNNIVKTEAKKKTTVETTTPVAETSAEKIAAEAPVAKETDKEDAKFSIVLASFVSKTNADAFIENLSKQGFKDGRYVKNGNVSRILYSSYQDKEKAQQALQELRKQSGEFAEAWILELQ